VKDVETKNGTKRGGESKIKTCHLEHGLRGRRHADEGSSGRERKKSEIPISHLLCIKAKKDGIYGNQSPLRGEGDYGAEIAEILETEKRETERQGINSRTGNL